MNKLTLVATLGLAAALILGGALSNQSRAVEIPVPNGDFETLYLPGSTTITGVVAPGGWSQGVGPDCPIDSGTYEFSDFTTGDTADIPGWVGFDRPGWINIGDVGYNGGTYGRRDWEDIGVIDDPADDDKTIPDPLHPDRFGNLQGSVGRQGASPDGDQYYLSNGGGWGNPAGGLIVSDVPLANVEAGNTYELSMIANGSATPVVLELLADGEPVAPTYSVHPDVSGPWQEFYRAYDATTLSSLLGKSLTIRLGVGRGASGAQSHFDTVSLASVGELVWDNANGAGDGKWGTPNNWNPDPDIPDAMTPATINSGTPLVEADHDALAVRINGGQLTIGAGNTLTLTNGINSAGTLVLENDSLLSTGSGSIATAAVDGRGRIGVRADNTLDVASVTAVPGKDPGELVKEDAGTLTLHADSIEASNLILADGTMIVVGATNTDFTAAGDGTLHLETAAAAAMGQLILESGTVTLTGAPGGITFAGTTVDAPGGGTVGFNHDGSLQLNQIDVVSAAAVTISKGGQADLILTDANAGTGLQHATFEAREGRLIGLQDTSNPFGSGTNAAGLSINGGDELVLAAATGPVIYDNALSVLGSGTLTAGAGGVGTDGPLTVTLGNAARGVNVAGGATLAIRSTDDYSLDIAGNLSGGGRISVDEGTVTLSGSANAIGSMEVAGGTVSTAGTDVTLSKRLVIGEVSYTVSDGNTFRASGTDLAAASRVTVTGGTLTIGGPPAVPTDGLELWLDASDVNGDGSAFANGAPVTTWHDKAGSDNPATAVGDPTFAATSSVLNDQPMVQFDGDDGFDLGNLGGLFPTEATMFVVAAIDNDEAWNLVTTRNNDTWWRYNGNSDSYPGMFRTDRINNYASGMPTDGPVVYAVTSSDAAWEMFENGTSLGAVGGQYNAGDDYGIGRPDNGNWGKGLNGGIAEILVFNAVLSAEDLNTVGVYLTDKYGLTTTYSGVVGGGPVEQTGTDVLVTANATLDSVESFVSLGNLTVQADHTSLGLQGAAYSFQNVSIADDITLTGELEVRGTLDVGNGVGDVTLGDGEIAFGPEATYNVEFSVAGQVGDADTIVLVGGANGLSLAGELKVSSMNDRDANNSWSDDPVMIVDNGVGEGAIGWLDRITDPQNPVMMNNQFDTVTPEDGTHLGQGVFLQAVEYVHPPGAEYVTTSVDLDVLIALGGDADGDGKVWLSDWAALRANFGNTGTGKTWTEGNFDPW
ncbi:MAG: hypothetical protein HQ567_11555, partial [Candidatus Nealsonbacteria bacterium]|nr:hypothetical protein [Candidatus Nealsonbacteria bacterium]